MLRAVPRYRRRSALVLAACLLLVAATGCNARAAVVASPPYTPNPAPGPVGPPKYFLYLPPNLPADTPPRVLVALHGMGGNGADFAKPFVAAAQRHGWILAAPTFNYGDWKNPAIIRAEDPSLCRQLMALLDDVSWRSGRATRARAYLVGFSRGAQLADRFAIFHPERVAAVASLSAGTYTLPQPAADLDDDGEADEALPLPFGTADMEQWVGNSLDVDGLRKVQFLVGVGSDDIDANDLPRQWDPVLGRTRVARAFAFKRSLEQLKIPTQLAVFAGARHQLTADMADSVDAFLTKLS
jgi:poly(3-hydroxybutyrate) depolymerase